MSKWFYVSVAILGGLAILVIYAATAYPRDQYRTSPLHWSLVIAPWLFGLFALTIIPSIVRVMQHQQTSFLARVYIVFSYGVVLVLALTLAILCFRANARGGMFGPTDLYAQ